MYRQGMKGYSEAAAEIQGAAAFSAPFFAHAHKHHHLERSCTAPSLRSARACASGHCRLPARWNCCAHADGCAACEGCACGGRWWWLWCHWLLTARTSLGL
jgi:hypothetical protein